MRNRCTSQVLLLFVLILSFGSALNAQTTQFTYQGSLIDNSQPANGNYDFEFALFDSLNGGIQIGSTITKSNVAVSDGVFSILLDFGSEFPGSNRFLELRVTQTGAVAAGGFTTLAPRQPVNSSPYSVKSLNSTTSDNANQLGGVNANQFVVTTDTRLSDARPPTSGSSNYIQNSTQPQTANFDISGTGKANIIGAATQFDLGGNRVLSTAGTSLFVGIDAGANNTTGLSSAFFGREAGKSNTTGDSNSFFGTFAGRSNTTGDSNSFFGTASGRENTTGHFNAFFGAGVGKLNTTGRFNSFFGAFVGNANTTGDSNAFFGADAGIGNTTGGSNSFFGQGAGNRNRTGVQNTIFGFDADVGSINLTNATAIGALSLVETSNSLVLGSIDGINNASADTNVGIGTTAPIELLHIAANSGQILFGDAGCNPGITAIGFSPTLTCTNYTVLGDELNTFFNRPVGGDMYFRENNATQMKLQSGGVLQLFTLGSAGSTPLCRNPSSEISSCSSSIRYKSNIEGFESGLDLIKKLRPVSFNWLDGGMRDLGLVAEEVAEVESLLTTTVGGKTEGVKYDRIGVVLVNAVNEQQAQIQELRAKIKALEAIVCELKPEAPVCRGKPESRETESEKRKTENRRKFEAPTGSADGPSAISEAKEMMIKD